MSKPCDDGQCRYVPDCFRASRCLASGSKRKLLRRHAGPPRWGIGFRQWFVGVVRFPPEPTKGVSFPNHPRIPAMPLVFEGPKED